MNEQTRYLILFIIIFSLCELKSKNDWRSRVIYQVLTDRFARGDNLLYECDVRKYCGGTYSGILNQLDYIQEMGFNAIWISPIFENSEDGYHGYYTTNFFKLNPHFGTEEDLIQLISECHRRDIWVMLDVVANHSGQVGKDFHLVHPFNKESHYHSFCEITKDDWLHNQIKVEVYTN
jgi:alpha-amylase